MEQLRKPGGYIAEIDTLRAVAVLLVAAQHWTWLLHDLPLGRLGVRLFFVISGFLITSILLDARERRQAGATSLGGELKTFYARRTLRIFPIYYLTLALLFTATAPGSVFQAQIWWHILYGTNILAAIQGQWPGKVTHFWSLAVEEQFYAVWPLFLLLVPRRMLLSALVAVVVSAPLFRAMLVGLEVSPIAVRVLTPSCLDTLGGGALLAYAHHRRSDWLRHVPRLALWVGLPLTILAYGWGLYDPDAAFVLILQDFGTAIACVGLIHFLVVNSGSPQLWMFRLKPLLYLGSISYGFYVYHAYMPDLFAAIGFRPQGWLRPIVFLPVAIAVASLSWWLFERPINKLKSRFPYGRAEKPGEAAVTTG